MSTPEGEWYLIRFGPVSGSWLYVGIVCLAGGEQASAIRTGLEKHKRFRASR